MNLRFTTLIFLLFCTSVYSQSIGSFPATTTRSGRTVYVSPTITASNVTEMLVTSSPHFMGVLTGNPSTGKVTVINPRPAGVYQIKVKAYNAAGASTQRVFNLTVKEPSCNQGDMNAGMIVTTGLNQVGAVVGDFNGDSYQDLAAAHEGGNNTLSIRIGNGSGSFSGTLEVPVGSHPYSVAIGDINLDGIQDLVTANSGDNSITPLLGVGNGTFNVQPVQDVGFGPISIVIADFDNDGLPDVATSNLNANSVSFRKGNGAGFFAITSEINVGANPYHIALGDFNNDGKVDFATANSAANTVSIRLNNGNAVFSNAPDVPVSQNPLCVAVADFNEDGNEDIATTNYMVNTVSIRFGDGHGNFSGSVEVPTGVGPYYVSVANFNGDTHKDMVIADYFDNDVCIRFGDGAGGFVNGNNVPVGSYPTCVTIGEFNQDHFLDLAVSNFNDGQVSIHLGQPGLPFIDSLRSNNPLCEGMDLLLQAYGGVTYLWEGPNGFTSGNQLTGKSSVTLGDTGYYRVTISDSAQCVVMDSALVQIWPSPVASFVLANDTVCNNDPLIQLTGGSPPGGLYLGNGVFGNFFDPGFTGPGTYTVNYVFSDEHDCSAADSQKIFVLVCTKAEEIADDNFLSVYPNPSTGELHFSKTINPITASLFSAEGVLIREWKLKSAQTTEVNIADLASGIYIVKFKDDDRIWMKKIIKN